MVKAFIYELKSKGKDCLAVECTVLTRGHPPVNKNKQPRKKI